VAEAYEARLRERGAVDYASMLALPLRLLRAEPPALRVLQDAYRFVMLDEAQDTCHVQNALLRLIVERHHNLMVVGDPQQCLPPGTLIQTPAGEVPIESIRPGDAVVAGVGRGQACAARVAEVLSRPFDGNLVRVTLKSGRIVRMTPTHMCFARQGCRPGSYYVYLMYRREFGYRIGMTSSAVYDAHLGRHVPGAAFSDEPGTRRQGLDPPCSVPIPRPARSRWRCAPKASRSGSAPTRTCSGGLRCATSLPTCVLRTTRRTGWPWHGSSTPRRRLRLVEQALRRRPVAAADLPRWAQKRAGPPGRRAVEALLASLEQLHRDARGCRPARVLELILERTGYAVWLASQQEGPARLGRIDELRAVVEGSPAPDLATWLAD
jgi:hypothetical protein